MQIYYETGKWGTFESENLALFFFENESPDGHPIQKSLIDFLKRTVFEPGVFDGKDSDLVPVYREGMPRQILLVGLGKKAEFNREKLRSAVSKLIKAVGSKQQSLFLALRDMSEFGIDSAECIQLLVETIDLSVYRFDSFQKKEKEKTSPQLEIVTLWGEGFPEEVMRENGRRGRQIAEATNVARDLANAPPNVATPTWLAAKAKEMETELGITTTVLSRRQMEKIGMGALLAVARGSQQEPKFIIMEYGQAFSNKGTVALVGKGITFDSGGISLKPGKNMDEMKYDMAGGAAVFGVLWAAARLEIPLHIIGLVPATENLPGGNAYKPGDIVTTLSGQTVEVLNTDAEGRLILADALTFAQNEFAPKLLIDLATLTGAAVVALGHAGAAVMGNASDIIQKIQQSADRTGEKVWPIPLWQEYHEQLKSSVADMKNIGGGPGGLPVAGAFLENFVEVPQWIHLDIAGVAWTTEEKTSYPGKGATGFGVRLLLDFLQKMAEK